MEENQKDLTGDIKSPGKNHSREFTTLIKRKGLAFTPANPRIPVGRGRIRYRGGG